MPDQMSDKQKLTDAGRGQARSTALSRECRGSDTRQRNHRECPRWSCAYKPGSHLVWDCECPCHEVNR